MQRLCPPARLLRQAAALPSLQMRALASLPLSSAPSPRARRPTAAAAAATACTACSAAVVLSRGSASSSARADAASAVPDASAFKAEKVETAEKAEPPPPATDFVPPEKVVPKGDMRLVLYQYDVCPFCNKVRAYLDFHAIPYTVVEVDPFGKTELQQFSKEYRKVPIAVVQGQQVNGSGSIISAARACVYGETGGVVGVKEARREEEWTEWVDEVLIHLISPNIYRTTAESLQAFEYIADNAKFSKWQRMSIRYSGAVAMYFVGKKIKKKYGIGEPRAAIYEAVDKWTGAVREGGGKFLGGGKPDTADLAMFGVLRAIEKFDTYRDIKENCQGFEEWFERTREAVGETSIVERR